MDLSDYKKRLDLLEGILQDFYFLLSNHSFPIQNYTKEPLPEEIYFYFSPLSNIPVPSPNPNQRPEIQISEDDFRRNFSCTICSDKGRGIHHFFQKGRKKVLVLHYSGITKSGEKYQKTGKLVLKTKASQEEWSLFLQKHLSLSMDEFYYQEYPGCHFHSGFHKEAWEKRTKNCESQVLQTIQNESIQGILVLGSAAILRWDIEFCNKNLGKPFYWELSQDTKIPTMILRSPEALVYSKTKNPEEHQKLQESMKQQIQEFFQFCGML